MNINIDDKIKRAIAFYLAVTLYVTLLPIILLYSLGYSIDFKTFRVYKTGIILLKSRPSGAYIYINQGLYPDLTPARIEKMKPGTYRVDVRRDGFYPWHKDLVVRPNMVTKAEDIVLFPLTQDMKRIIGNEIVDFAISQTNQVYYMTERGLFKSNLDGSGTRKISSYSAWPQGIRNKKFSPDGAKLLLFGDRAIWVVFIPAGDALVGRTPQSEIKVVHILDAERPIIDAFWYSQGTHIIFVTESDINVMEVDKKGEENLVTLYKFERSPQDVYYDEVNDSIYFADFSTIGTEKGKEAKKGNYLYRLDLRKKFFDEVMKILTKELELTAGYEDKNI